MDITTEIRDQLFSLRDAPYADFQRKLIPNIPPDTVIGVRTPVLKKLAKEYAKREDIGAFLTALPHTYFDENQLHAFLLCEEKDGIACMDAVGAFLPYIDNWATCDQLVPRSFQGHRKELSVRIDTWLAAVHTYTVRFAIGMRMRHFLEEDFDAAYMEEIARLCSQEYYINMMIAWYFATALAKQYDTAVTYLTDGRLETWTHNKTIQKAIESRRICSKKKAYLKTLRRK